ncbi:hypothetical protein M758_1G141000 [Ceratodon purpureus]|nr:hypothetical protein M758_1G141000 [Ceratodon purpureus]
MADNETERQKLAYFQEITGVKDTSLSHQILEAYGWDLDSAVHAMVDKNTNVIPEYEESMRVVADVRHPDVLLGDGGGVGLGSGSSSDGRGDVLALADVVDDRSLFGRIGDGEHRDEAAGDVQGADGTTFVWRVVTLPFLILRGSYNLIHGVFGLGVLLAGGLLSAGLGVLRLTGVPSLAVEAGTLPNAAPIFSVPSGATEASNFLRAYERRYGENHPEFQAVSFMEALRRAGQEFKFLFVYLHAPQHANTPAFCETTLQNEAVVDFINANFIAWGADIHKTEGYQMSNSLNASTFPFCAVILGSTDQRISVVRQAEGFRTAGELMSTLQAVIEEQSDSLIAGRQEQEARDLNCRLREEQDEAYRIGLEADQERERRERAEEDRAARDRYDADKKKAQDDKEAAQAAYILARKEENLAQLRRDKALNLGPEPEGGADVTYVAVRLPNGERKERRFINTTKVQALYDYIESLNSFKADSFLLISNFPRVDYGTDKLDLTLKDAGLHPRTSLFVQVQEP